MTRLRPTRDQRGAALIEFALVFPLLFFILIGSLSLLWLLAARSAVTGAARDGARYASIRHDSVSCTFFPCPAEYPDQLEVESFVNERVGSFGPVTVVLEAPAGPNAPVTVRVSRKLPIVFAPIASMFGSKGLLYESDAKVRAE